MYYSMYLKNAVREKMYKGIFKHKTIAQRYGLVHVVLTEANIKI